MKVNIGKNSATFERLFRGGVHGFTLSRSSVTANLDSCR
jgi:hypothetical protein